MTPDLFDHAAERIAFDSGRSISQTKTELVHGSEAPAIGGLFDVPAPCVQVPKRAHATIIAEGKRFDVTFDPSRRIPKGPLYLRTDRGFTVLYVRGFRR